MSDRPIDPDAPFKSFQKRLGAGELRTPELNDQNRRLFGIPSQIVVREAFMADRENIPDSFQGEVERQRLMARRG
jgi:hypothetical protein